MWPWQRQRSDGPSLIGPGVRITGRVESAGELTICGRVEGDIFHSGRLVIGEGACCISNIRAESMQVAGEVHGNVEVAGALELLPAARLYGDTACAALQVRQGAVFTGTNRMAGTVEIRAPLAVLSEPVSLEEREVLGALRVVTPPMEEPAAEPASAVERSTPRMAAPPAGAPAATAFQGGFVGAVAK